RRGEGGGGRAAAGKGEDHGGRHDDCQPRTRDGIEAPPENVEREPPETVGEPALRRRLARRGDPCDRGGARQRQGDEDEGKTAAARRPPRRTIPHRHGITTGAGGNPIASAQLQYLRPRWRSSQSRQIW